MKVKGSVVKTEQVEIQVDIHKMLDQIFNEILHKHGMGEFDFIYTKDEKVYGQEELHGSHAYTSTKMITDDTEDERYVIVRAMEIIREEVKKLVP